MNGPATDKVMLVLRSAQVRIPLLRNLKEQGRLRWQAVARRPHERDFTAIPGLDPPPRALYVDIGANLGQSILSIRSQDRDARVIAFEPNTALLDGLHRVLGKDDDVVIEPYALGDQDGGFTLYLPVYNGWAFHGLSSLDRDEAAGWLADDRIIGFDPDKLVIQEIPCEVRRLDSFDLDPWFVKVDVQGLEAEVLLGGQETIARSLPILMLEATPFEGKVRDVLAPLGYEPAVLRDGELRHADRDALNIFYLPPHLTDRIRS
jgi:FkbM family methyltransferase